MAFANDLEKEMNTAHTGNGDVALLSGFTVGTLNTIIGAEDITPVSIMKNALNKPEYDVVDKVLNK